MKNLTSDITLSISGILLENHSCPTPHSVAVKTPAELMFGRLLQTGITIKAKDTAALAQI